MTELEKSGDAYARKHSGLGPKDPRYQRYYRAFIAGAAAEREACAKLVETECIVMDSGLTAQRIRARGNSPRATLPEGKGTE